MLRPRVTCSANPQSGLLIIRCIGNLDGQTAAERMRAHISAVPDAWDYDHIIDFGRFEGLFLGSDSEALLKWWSAASKGRDAGRLTAVISSDPLVQARQAIGQALMPNRRLAVFARFSEGCDWIIAERHALAAA